MGFEVLLIYENLRNCGSYIHRYIYVYIYIYIYRDIYTGSCRVYIINSNSGTVTVPKILGLSLTPTFGVGRSPCLRDRLSEGAIRAWDN